MAAYVNENTRLSVYYSGLFIFYLFIKAIFSFQIIKAIHAQVGSIGQHEDFDFFLPSIFLLS